MILGSRRVPARFRGMITLKIRTITFVKACIEATPRMLRYEKDTKKLLVLAADGPTTATPAGVLTLRNVRGRVVRSNL